jgi:hypothetical protein
MHFELLPASMGPTLLVAACNKFQGEGGEGRRAHPIGETYLVRGRQYCQWRINILENIVVTIPFEEISKHPQIRVGKNHLPRCWKLGAELVPMIHDLVATGINVIVCATAQQI